MNKSELSKIINNLDLPKTVRDDLIRDYASHNSEMPQTKSMVKMSGNGREAAIILWENDTITVISTDSNRQPHISSAKSPEIYYIAQKHYIDLGMQIVYAEEDGKKIGIR